MSAKAVSYTALVCGPGGLGSEPLAGARADSISRTRTGGFVSGSGDSVGRTLSAVSGAAGAVSRLERFVIVMGMEAAIRPP